MKLLAFVMLASNTSSQGLYNMAGVLPFSSGESRDCKLTITKILFVSCPNRFFAYSTEKFKQTGNRGIKDHGFLAPLIGVHEVVAKVPDN